MYNLNHISLYDYGFVAGRQPNSNLALSGFLDGPARLGKTFHDWAEEVGVQPYVSASEIFLGGRDLNLTGYIQGTDRFDCENKRLGIVSLINGFTDLVPLESKWGINNVYVNGVVKGEYFSDQFLGITIPMREPQPVAPGNVPVGDDSEFGIDGISFKNLGGVALELADRRNRPAPKPFNLTGYGKETYAITKTVAPELTLRLFIEQPTFAAFAAKVNGIRALFSAPGLRNLTMNNDKIRSLFSKDGFTVTNMYSYTDRFLGIIDVRFIESGTVDPFQRLIDSLGNIVTDKHGNTIKIRI